MSLTSFPVNDLEDRLSIFLQSTSTDRSGLAAFLNFASIVVNIDRTADGGIDYT